MVYLYAHRGNNHHSYKENSIQAVVKCLQLPYIDGVEIDVRFTYDKKIVVSHSPTISIHNSYYFIKNLTLLETLKNSDLVELSFFLSKIKSPKRIFIEVKYEGKLEKGDIDILYAVLKKYSFLNLWIGSFHYSFIKNFQKKYPSFPCGIFLYRFYNYFYLFKPFSFYFVHYSIATHSKKNIFFFTVNQKDTLEKIKKKVKNKPIHIITDKAYLLKE